MFLSKKGKAFKGNKRDKIENIENMTKILFEEVSSLNRRFKILEKQVKTIIQEMYGFRRINYDQSKEGIASIQQSPPEVKDENEEPKSSTIAQDFSQAVSIPSPPSSNDFFSPPLSLSSEEDIATPASQSFTASPSESAHPPKTPTFPSPSHTEVKDKDPTQKDTIYQLIPRVKLATKTRTDQFVKSEE
ncbi:MAG: hypothetical protein ACETWM_15040 [Candidatus Lokiarchaeia archaeon]